MFSRVNNWTCRQTGSLIEEYPPTKCYDALSCLASPTVKELPEALQKLSPDARCGSAPKS